MLEKISVLKPDGFILDLEDSVPVALKEQARKNIIDKLESIETRRKIFVRINDLDSIFFIDDIRTTVGKKIFGFMVPKFESISKLELALDCIEFEEKKVGLFIGEKKLILMIESASGIFELDKLEKLGKKKNRVLALAIGWEDFSRDFMVFSEVSDSVLDYVRFQVLFFAKAFNWQAIDTVFKEFNNSVGLEELVLKVAGMGFNGKLAIHPSQIEIINRGFLPSEDDLTKMELILENRQRIEGAGAVNIGGIMYDPPHLKWAMKIKNYIEKIENI